MQRRRSLRIWSRAPGSCFYRHTVALSNSKALEVVNPPITKLRNNGHQLPKIW